MITRKWEITKCVNSYWFWQSKNTSTIVVTKFFCGLALSIKMYTDILKNLFKKRQNLYLNHNTQYSKGFPSCCNDLCNPLFSHVSLGRFVHEIQQRNDSSRGGKPSLNVFHSKQLTVWRNTLLQKKSRNPLPYTEFEGSLHFSQEIVSGSCSESTEFSPQAHTLFL